MRACIRFSLLTIALVSFAALGCRQVPASASIQKLPEKAPGRYLESLMSGGLSRTYILRVPKAYDATKPLSLVVVLHGWTSNAEKAELYTRMGTESDKEGFVLAIPDGTGPKGLLGWNVGFINLGAKGVDDVAFIDSLITKVEAEVGIDANRVYVAGHSNGAFLADLVGSRLANKIAAIAAVAGTVGLPDSSHPGSFITIPDPVSSVSVLLIHGKKDPMVQYDKSDPALLHGIGAMDSAKWWAKEDGCSATPAETVDGNGNLITDTFTGGKGGSEVTLVSVVNGVHDWPGGLTEQGPETTTGLNAADLIWAFFKAHPKAK